MASTRTLGAAATECEHVAQVWEAVQREAAMSDIA